MANTKLDRIERDIEKTRAKILEQQKKLKDLEAQKRNHLAAAGSGLPHRTGGQRR